MVEYYVRSVAIFSHHGAVAFHELRGRNLNDLHHELYYYCKIDVLCTIGKKNV